MLSAARVNIIRILSCIKVASISLFNPPSPLPPYHSASSVAPPSGCSLHLSFLNQLGAFISWPLPISPALPSHCLLFALPVSLHHPFSPVSSSLHIYRSLSEPWLLLYPSPCSPPPYPSLLCHPLLSFVFTSTSIFIHLSQSLSLSSPLPHPFFVPLWTSPFFFFCPQSLSLLSYPAVSSLCTCLSFWLHSFMY